jgi:hypothetical protein
MNARCTSPYDPSPGCPNPWSDRALIDACLAGSSQAWDELYQVCHDKLLSSIRHHLGPQKSQDLELVDEVSARVWYAMVRNDGALLDRFDPRLGARITTFFAVIAKDLLYRLYRSENRRGRREAIFLEHRADNTPPNLAQVVLDEFREGLTPAEQRFYDTVLMVGQPNPAEAGYSQANAWQLSSRIYRKLSGELAE